jgi:hypothetical protein
VAAKGSSLPEGKQGFRIERIPCFFAKFRRNRWHTSILSNDLAPVYRIPESKAGTPYLRRQAVPACFGDAPTNNATNPVVDDRISRKPLLFGSVIDEPNGFLTVLSKINAYSIVSQSDLSSMVCFSSCMVDMGGLN